MTLDEVEYALQWGQEPVDGWLTALATAVDDVNDALAGDRSRIGKLVERLRDVARRVAEKVHAHAYSVSVGLPAGVSVTIEWERD